MFKIMFKFAIPPDYREDKVFFSFDKTNSSFKV